MTQKNLNKLYPQIDGGTSSKFGFGKLSFIPTDTEPTAAEGVVYYDDSENTLKVYDGSSWNALSTATASGTGLDGSYDLNYSITVDSNPVTLTGSNADVLYLTQSANDDGLYINKTGTGAGYPIKIANSGTGEDIYGTSGTWKISKAGLATFGNIVGNDLTLTSSTVSVTTDVTDTTAFTLNIDTVTTGKGLVIDGDAGTGANYLEIQDASTAKFSVRGGDGALTIAGDAEGTDAITLTKGDITITDGDLTVGGQVTITPDANADGVVITDPGSGNYDLLYLNGSTNAGSGNIIDIDQGAAARTGHMINLDMGSTAVAMSAIDISCTGGTRTVPIIKIDSDGTASDFIHCVTSGVFTGNMINLVQDTGAGTGNFIFINNDTGTSMEAINIDDEANTQDVIYVNCAAATADNKALLNLVHSGTPAAAGSNILRVDGSGLTATNNPTLVEIIGTGVDVAALNIDVDCATQSGVKITGSGAIADNTALLEVTGDGTPAAAGSNLVRIDGSGLTVTNKPTIFEIDGTGVDTDAVFIDSDSATNSAVLINGGGAIADNKAVLEVTADGTMVAGSSIVRIGSSTAAGGATVYGLEIACDANNLEALYVSAGKCVFDEAISGAGVRGSVSVELSQFTANTTVYVPIMAVPTDITIDKVYLAARVIPVDADGTCTVRVVNYDVSATADDEIVAAWDAEGLTAKTSTSMTVITTDSINALSATDYLYVELTNNSAAIDTNWEDAVLTIEYHYT